MNYPFTQQISVKTQTKNGIVWETESEVSPQGALARMAASYTKHPQFSLDRIELQTDGKLSSSCFLFNPFPFPTVSFGTSSLILSSLYVCLVQLMAAFRSSQRPKSRSTRETADKSLASQAFLVRFFRSPVSLLHRLSLSFFCSLLLHE